MNTKRLWFVEFSNNKGKEWVLLDYTGYEKRRQADQALYDYRNDNPDTWKWRVALFERKPWDDPDHARLPTDTQAIPGRWRHARREAGVL